MFDEPDPATGLPDGDEAYQILRELESNTTEEIRRRRSHFRLALKIGVILQPGNTSELSSFKVKGVTGDISGGGCSTLLPIPVRVGDIYRLQFDRGAFDVPLTFARCVRCRLVREGAFEAGFAFFNTIALPKTLAVQSASDSGG